MITRFARAATALGIAALLSSAVVSTANASGTFSGTVTATFSNPVLSGNVIDINGSNLPLDNSGTAFFTGMGTNDITWGTTPGSSHLFFLSDSFSNVSAGDTIHLGTIIYTNGTSDLTTLIFGTTMTLSTGGVTDPLVSAMNIVTTNNTGLSPARDSDFIGFSDFPETFNVYEGATSSIELFGHIVGDPQLKFDSIVVSAVATDAGFIGHGVGGIPEPAAWMFMILGFFGLGGALRVRRSRQVPALA